MQIRNKSDAPRFLSVPARNFFTGDIEPGECVDVDDELGESLCSQEDIWEATGNASESPKDRRTREKSEALAAFVASEAAPAADKAGE